MKRKGKDNVTGKTKGKDNVTGKTTAMEVACAAEDWSTALVNLCEKSKIKNHDIVADIDIEYHMLLAQTEYVRCKRNLLHIVNDWIAGGCED